MLRTAWPAFAMAASLVVSAVGVFALHQSMQDYRTPMSGGLSAYR